jgi:hypothetical protein
MSASNGNGNGKVPSWLAALGIMVGEYFSDSKLRAKRAMRSRYFSPEARVHICLGLHTMGYQQELAVKMEAGKRVPLTPADVCSETGLSRKHFREYMNNLEAAGLGAMKGSTKGRVELYAWAVPRAVDVNKIVPRAGTISSSWAPQDLQSLLNHYRIRLPDGLSPAPGQIEELERLARGAKEAELSLRAYANGLRARTLYKEERNERNSERNGEAGRQAEEEGAAAEPACLPPEPPATADPPSPPPPLAELRTLFPDDHLADDDLNRLDRYLAGLTPNYDPVRYVRFVAGRQRRGEINTGLVFDPKGLPADFVAKMTAEQKTHRGEPPPKPRPAPSHEDRIAELRQEIADAEEMLKTGKWNGGKPLPAAAIADKTKDLEWKRERLEKMLNGAAKAAGG